MKSENISSISNDLDLGQYLADLAFKIAMSYFRTKIISQFKNDGTPVTKVDLEVEEKLKNIIFKERPNDAIIGEEFGNSKISDRKWILDPIDGTSEFIAGTENWGTHIALEENGEIILGIITRPALNRRWWAIKKGGAYNSFFNFNETNKITLSSTSKLKESKIAIWEKSMTSRVMRLKEIGIWVEPSLSNIVEFLDGKIDAFVDVIGKPWDHAPVAIITEEAGGNFKDYNGGKRIDIGEVRYTNGKLGNELYEILNISNDNIR